MNFVVNFARFLEHLFCITYEKHIQNRCSKKYRKIHGKTPMLESLFNKVAGLRPATLLKKHFSTGVLLSILGNFYIHVFYRVPLNDCLNNNVQISLH